jgi:hypothetical protein
MPQACMLETGEVIIVNVRARPRDILHGVHVKDEYFLSMQGWLLAAALFPAET